MERTYINEVQKEIGSTVKVQGFIENLRNSKYMAFIVLKDITGKLQITVEKADHPDLVDTIDKLTPDSVITVTGKVMENDYVKMGGIEMIPEAIEIESIANGSIHMSFDYDNINSFLAGKMTVGIDETMQDYAHKLERARTAKQLESGKKRRRKPEPPAEAET